MLLLTDFKLLLTHILFIFIISSVHNILNLLSHYELFNIYTRKINKKCVINNLEMLITILYHIYPFNIFPLDSNFQRKEKKKNEIESNV